SHTTARIRYRRPPAECRENRAGALADARSCGPANSDTPPPADRDSPRVDHPAHRSTGVRFWFCPAPDRARAPVCRRRATSPPHIHSGRAMLPAVRATAMRCPPTPRASRGRGPLPSAGRFLVADTADSGRRTWRRSPARAILGWEGRDRSGVLQADAYSGFAPLYASGDIVEAACWAHARRKFYDLYVVDRSPIATEAIQRIGALYAIEREIRGRVPAQRAWVRQQRAGSLLDALHQWLSATLQT